VYFVVWLANKQWFERRGHDVKKKTIPRLLLTCIIFCNVLIGINSVAADTPMPQSPYTVVFESDNKVFRMSPPWHNSTSQLRSGLYYDSTPPVNIYYVNDYFYEKEIIFSDDGIYFVHLPWSGSASGGIMRDARGNIILESLDGIAVEFYMNGVLLKRYQVGEIIKNAAKLAFSATHVSWEKIEYREFNAKANILAITTKDNLVYNFDVTTGNVLSKSELKAILGATEDEPATTIWSRILYIAAPVVVLAVVTGIFLKRKGIA